MKLKRDTQQKNLSIIIVFIINLCFTFSNITIAAAGKQPNTTDHGNKNISSISARQAMEGVIIIKFKDHLPTTLNMISSNIPSLNAKINKYKAVSINRVFPFLKNSGSKEKEKLQKIYYLYYNDKSNPKDVAANFNNDPNIEFAEPKYIYPLLEEPNDIYYDTMSQFTQIHAQAAWDVIKGDSGEVVIAIVDGGTDWDHEDLVDNIWTNTDEIPDNGLDDDDNGYVDDIRGWNFPAESNDPTGLITTPSSASHGTHTAGIAVGVTNNTIGIASISWNCILMPINAAHPTADRSILYGYEGIVYAAENGADIINCSWGSQGYPSLFEQIIIDFAYSENALVVAAAGNDGSNNDDIPFYPSGYNTVLSVGATYNANDNRVSFSNYGVSVNVFAPGVNILSTIPNDEYGYNSGTSMASPLVAGLAGLVKTQNPSWNVDQIREQVRVNCDNIDDANPSYAGLLGKGRINAHRAVTEFSSPAIQIHDISFLESGGDGIINDGESVDVIVSLKNYLTSTSNVSLTLSENDDNITITNGSGSISIFNTDDIHDVPFQFTVATGLPNGYVLKFFLDITDGNYVDQDFFRLYVNPPQYKQHDTGLLQTAITTEGNIGWIAFKNESEGIGFVFNGQDFLFEGGLLIGKSPTQVSNCVRGNDGSIQDNHFRMAKNDSLSLTSPGEYTSEEGSILLVDSSASVPIGISIQQTSYADSSSNNKDFVIFSYEITNITQAEITNLYTGLFFDWDLNEYANDYSRYDTNRRMGYVTNSLDNPTMLAATKLLTTNSGISYHDINNSAEIYDGFTINEKWNFLSGGIQTQSLDDIDISTIMSEGPFNIPVGESIEVAFAVIGANSLIELQTSADNAQDFWDNITLPIDPINNPIPISYALNQNYPNPFNPSTIIPFSISNSGEIKLIIYNILGQEVRTLLNRNVSPGFHKISWDGNDNNGNKVSSGIYFYQLTVSGEENLRLTKKLIIMK